MKENNDKILRTLRAFFFTMIGVTFLIVVLFECGLLNSIKGSLSGRKQMEFIFLTAMEIITLLSIPLSLKLLRFKPIRKKIEADKRKYTSYAILRMQILILPMIFNTLLYYFFHPLPTFGYMAIIQLICLCFITPSRSRIEEETEEEEPKTAESSSSDDSNSSSDKKQ